MTARTIAIRSFVIYWEGMTIDIYISPSVAAVATGALTAPVVVRSRMAGLAIRQTRMVKTGWLPGVGAVAA